MYSTNQNYTLAICQICKFSSVQSLSRVRLFVFPWTAARQASLSITNSQSLLKPMSIESVMPSNHLIHFCLLLLVPSIFPSIRVFPNESTLSMRGSKYCSFSFSIILSKEHPGLFSFRIDWFNLLEVQRTLKSLLQHYNSRQFKSINSSAFSLLCGPTLSSIHGYWKNHSFDYMDLCWQSTKHFAFLHFFFFGMVFVTASCTVLWNSIHSSSGAVYQI